jgi:hypothetical protein
VKSLTRIPLCLSSHVFNGREGVWQPLFSSRVQSNHAGSVFLLFTLKSLEMIEIPPSRIRYSLRYRASLLSSSQPGLDPSHHSLSRPVAQASHMIPQEQPLTLFSFGACRLRVLRGHWGEWGATSHLPHGLCEVGYKIRGPCFYLLLAYPASSPPIPAHYQRCVPDSRNLLLGMINGTYRFPARSDSLSSHPVSHWGFLIYIITLPQGRQVEP